MKPVVRRAPGNEADGDLLTLRQRLGELERSELDNKAAQDQLRSLIHELEVHQEELRTQNENILRAQSEVAESQQRYVDLFEYAPLGYLFLDRDGIIHEVNLRGADMFGRPRNGIVGKPLWLYVRQDFRDPLARHLREVFRRHHAVVEVTVRRGDGSVFHGALESVLVEEKDRPERYCRTALMDVSERVLAEQAMAESEARFRELFNNMSSGVAVLEARGGDEGAFVFADLNRAAERIEGLKRDQVLGRSVQELFPAAEELGLLNIFRRVWRTGEPERHAPAFYKDERRSGWRESYVYRLPSREVVAVYDDVTERIEAEEAVRESEERFRNLIEGSIQGIYIHRNWKPLFVNQAYAEMLGYESPEEVIAVGSLMKMVASHERTRLQRFLKQRLHGGKVPVQYEYEALTKDGGVIVLQKVVRLISWEGEPAVQDTVVDVTARKNAEEEAKQRAAELAHLARVSTMGEMATTLAHELNQPLTAIVSYSEGAARRLRRSGETESPLLEVMDRTAALAKRAAETIRGIRDFVRKQDVELQYVNLNEVAEEAIRLMVTEAKQKGIALTTHFGSSIPPVEGNFVQFEQVVLNLLRNAIEVMEGEQERPKRMTVRTFTNGEEELILSVRDTGPGLEPEVVSKLFDPFVSTKPDGMGMGLSISRTIVEAYGGRLWARPSPGGGAVFQMAVPVCSRGETNAV